MSFSTPAGHTRSTASEKVLTLDHPAARLLEAQVASGCFTAWACATPSTALSVFFADEACPRGEGLADPLGPFHPSFDLASLTKPLFLNLYLRILWEARAELFTRPLVSLITPRTPAGALLHAGLASLAGLKSADTGLERAEDLTLLDLLDHRSGFKPWMWFGKGLWAFAKVGQTAWDARAKAHLELATPSAIRDAVQEGLVHHALNQRVHPLGSTHYSDINYFLLAVVVENLASSPSSSTEPSATPSTTSSFESWSAVVDTINARCGGSFTHASVSPEASERAIPYFPYIALQDVDELHRERGLGAFGPVHDTNANLLAGLGRKVTLVSGHAGLFGTVIDVLRGMGELARTQEVLLSAPTFAGPTGRPGPGGFSRFGRFVFGLDTPSGIDSNAGLSHWPLQADTRVFGHLGYTGTHFWFALGARDAPRAPVPAPEKAHHSAHILLTNRTASRTRYGVERVPRIAVRTDIVQGITHYFMQSKDHSWHPLSEDSAFEIMQTHRNATGLVWDRNSLRQVPDLLGVRREVGRALWNPL